MSASPQANATAHRLRKPCSARAVVHAVRPVRSAGSISTAKGRVIRPLDPAVNVVRVTNRPRVELQDAPKIVISSLSITHQAIGKREPQPGQEAGQEGGSASVTSAG